MSFNQNKFFSESNLFQQKFIETMGNLFILSNMTHWSSLEEGKRKKQPACS